jgi:hypothetical protein
MEELTINGQKIELSSNTTIALTIQANNIGELQNRQGNFTNSFNIPLTQKNKKTFEFLNVITSGTNLPYQKLYATYKRNGIEIISEGSVNIQGVDSNNININILSGNVDLSSAIENLIVGELYLTEPTHVWNALNAVNSRTLTKDYVYPLIDWRTDLDTFF